jgi:hypothetical protein
MNLQRAIEIAVKAHGEMINLIHKNIHTIF